MRSSVQAGAGVTWLGCVPQEEGERVAGAVRSPAADPDGKRQGAAGADLLHRPAALPGQRAMELYQNRWEIELGYREMKHSLQQHRADAAQQETRWSKQQELWGLVLAYNLPRYQMVRDGGEFKGLYGQPVELSLRHRRICCMNSVARRLCHRAWFQGVSLSWDKQAEQFATRPPRTKPPKGASKPKPQKYATRKSQ